MEESFVKCSKRVPPEEKCNGIRNLDLLVLLVLHRRGSEVISVKGHIVEASGICECTECEAIFYGRTM